MRARKTRPVSLIKDQRSSFPPAITGYYFLNAIFVGVLMAFAGCNSATWKSNQSDGMAPSDGLHSARQCSSHCLDESMYFGCAALGTDAVPSINLMVLSADDAFRHLEDQARGQGGRIHRTSVSEGLKSLNVKVPCSMILVDLQGHLHVVVQRRGQDDTAHLQILHGRGKGKLIKATEIVERGEFVEAWLIDGQPANIPVAVGAGKVLIEKFVQDLGEVPAGQKRSFHFKIRNEGQTPVLLVKAKSSCACTTVEDVAGVRISRGGTYDLKVQLTAEEAGSQRQWVELDFCCPSKEAIVTRRFTVLLATSTSSASVAKSGR